MEEIKMNIANAQGQIFSVCRTSEVWNDNKPCEEAIFDEEDKRWYLPSFCFNDLSWFTKKYNECGAGVLIREGYKSGKADYDIEIYDDYRE
jgi:hypothetical protein